MNHALKRGFGILAISFGCSAISPHGDTAQQCYPRHASRPEQF